MFPKTAMRMGRIISKCFQNSIGKKTNRLLECSFMGHFQESFLFWKKKMIFIDGKFSYFYRAISILGMDKPIKD